MEWIVGILLLIIVGLVWFIVRFMRAIGEGLNRNH